MTRRLPFAAGLLLATALASFTAFSFSSSSDIFSRPTEGIASAAAPRTLLQAVEEEEAGGATQSASPTEMPTATNGGAGAGGGGDEGPGGLPMRVEDVSGGRGETEMNEWMDRVHAVSL